MRRLLPALAVALSALTVPVVATATPALAATAVSGPDVASYQHPNGAPIDWGAVKRSGRSFGIVKATEGTFYTNPYFAQDWKGMAAAGLVRGSYDFVHPQLPLTTAFDQAKYYVAALGSLRAQGDLPPALDLEVNDDGLTPGQLVMWTQLWLSTVQSLTGRVPMIYSYRWFWQNQLRNSDAFDHYPLWIADYNGASTPTTPLVGSWPSWTMWQYTSQGSVPGISGGVDLSNFNGTATELAALANGSAPQSWAVRVPASPQYVTAALGAANGTATVSWVPGDNGGELLQHFIVTASPGGRAVMVSGSTTSMLFTGLADGTTYHFTVTATNSNGTSPASAASNPVTPLVPTTIASRLTQTTTRFGGLATMSARLTRSDTGTPVTGRSLAVLGRYRGTTTWHHVANVTTNSNGVGSYTWRPQQNTEIQLAWTPDPGWQPAASYVRTAWVTPVATAGMTSSVMLPNRPVALQGRVVPNHPNALVLEEVYLAGAWHVWASTRVQSDGTYRFLMHPTHAASYTFRVVIPATPSFLATASAPTTLRVL